MLSAPQTAVVVTLADPAPLAEILCIEDERVVARDNTIVHEGRRLQLPQSPVRAHYVKARVKVRSTRMGRSRCSMARAVSRGIARRELRSPRSRLPAA